MMDSRYATMPASPIHSHSNSTSGLPYTPSRLGRELTAASDQSDPGQSPNQHDHSHSESRHQQHHQHRKQSPGRDRPAEYGGRTIRSTYVTSPSAAIVRSPSPLAQSFTHTYEDIINIDGGHEEHEEHDHSHQHEYGHSHGHSHGHSPSQVHSHDNHTHHDSTSHLHDHSHDHSHGHDHNHNHDHNHSHNHTHTPETRSKFSNFLLPLAEGSPLLHSILLEKDSRRLLYFMSLNFCFMMVQAFYGYVTDSLGLLSDSIHMFFDCLALAMGLFAAVSSKWPPSRKFPYGFAKIESLSGFGNGVFLLLISIEIMIEAVERLAEGRETKRLSELLIVSSMGLAVNLVGMMAFGHHHHGHSHGGEGCSHGHSHADHSHSHDHKDHLHSPANSLSAPPTPLTTTLTTSSPQPHSNQNMAGIYLHILADTMGSAAVIVSTLLIQYLPGNWSGWDPIASCIIAILIFLSSLPLVTSSAQQLLLTLPADTEYKLRSTLSELSALRGVASYSVPRFWMSNGSVDPEDEKKHGHGHGHKHKDSHGHSHEHTPSSEPSTKEQVMGVIHVAAARSANLEHVRQRVVAHLREHGMNVLVQVDREGMGKCWCGGDGTKTPSSTINTRFL